MIILFRNFMNIKQSLDAIECYRFFRVK
ncbi:hypothetical protein SA508_04525, partial [Aggregatibacter actinomycetemcomitans serotype d str. SA508]